MIRDMLEALAGLGYPIFPCVRKDKAPLTANGYKDATTDMVTIDRWLKIHTDCNWAIAVPDTVIVLDIDSLDGGTQNQWPRDPELAATLMDCGALSITPRKGRHMWFRQPSKGRWSCTAGKIAAKVDTRCTNGYVLIPPSSTRDGEYSWLPDMELNLPPEKLPLPPDWLCDMLDSNPGRRHSDKPGERVTACPAECQEVVDHGLQVWVNCSPYWHEKALAMLECSGAAVSGVVDDVTYWTRPGKERGVSATWNHPCARHGAKESTTIKLGYPRLSVFTPNWPPFKDRESLGTYDIIKRLTPTGDWPNIEQQMLAHMDAALITFHPHLFHEVGHEEPEAYHIDPAASDGDEAAPQVKYLKAEPENNSPKAGSQKHGFRKGGIIDLTLQSIHQAEFMRQPGFNLAAAFSIMSVCLSTKVTARKTMPNLYCLCVANTGEGKNASQIAVRRILEATDPPKPEGAILHGMCIGIPHSDSGLLTAIKHGATRLIRADEMAAYLKAGMRNGNGYTARLVTLLTELYTHGRGAYTPPVYADEKKNTTIDQTPFVSIFGSTTPQQLADAMDAESVEGGLLPRILMFRGLDEAPVANPETEYKIPVPLAEQVRAWRIWTPPGSQMDPHVDWKLTTDAKKLLDEKSKEWLKSKREGLRNSDMASAIYTRQAQNLTKLALLIAADRCEKPTAVWSVEESDIQMGAKLIEWMGNEMRKMIRNEMAQTLFEKHTSKVYKFISCSGDIGVSRSDILTKFKHLRSNELSDILSLLIERRNIPEPKNGIINSKFD